MTWPQGTLAFNVHKHAWLSARGRGAATGVWCSRVQGRCQHVQCPGQLPNEPQGHALSSLTLLMNSYSSYSPNPTLRTPMGTTVNFCFYQPLFYVFPQFV